MIILKNISITGMKYAVIDGDLCAVAHTYSVTGSGVIELTPEDKDGYRNVKIVLIKDIGNLSIDYIDGQYIIDNNNDVNVIVNVDFTSIKKQRGRIGSSKKWAEYAQDHNLPEGAVLLKDTAFDRVSYDICGYGGFYLILQKNTEKQGIC